MALHPVYRVTFPNEAPAPPAMWSHSSLTNVEECPLRLWLARAHYEFGAWPSRSNAAGVSGTVIHELMREFAFEWEKTGAPSPGSQAFDEVQEGFGVRQRAVKQRQKALIPLRSNPRVVFTELERGVELGQCIRQFNELRTRLYAASHEEEVPEQSALSSLSFLTPEVTNIAPRTQQAPDINPPSARREESELKIEARNCASAARSTACNSAALEIGSWTSKPARPNRNTRNNCNSTLCCGGWEPDV